MSLWIPAAIYLGIVLWVAAILRTAGRRTPVPPARPRMRLVQDRERTGVVEFLPTVGDAQNGQIRPQREVL